MRFMLERSKLCDRIICAAQASFIRAPRAGPALGYSCAHVQTCMQVARSPGATMSNNNYANCRVLSDHALVF